MKKSLIFAGVLMGMAVLSLPVALIWVDRGKEDIFITEEVLYGDPAEAAGLTLKIPTQWRRQLLWDTELTIGSGKEAESKFTFSSREVFWEGAGAELEAGLRVVYGSGFGSAFTEQEIPLEWAPEYDLFIGDVKERTEIGEKHTESVRIGDYVSNYPLRFSMSGGHSVMFQGDYEEACRYLTEYFHLSPDRDRMEVTVEKNAGGEVTAFKCEMEESDEMFSLVSASADGGQGIYYVYCLQNAKTEESVDRGQNRGIFYFPYSGTDIWDMDLTRVRKAGDFPEDAVPLKMLADRAEGILYLAVRDREGYSLLIYRLEGETAALAQQIPVGRNNLSGNMAYLREMKDGMSANDGDTANSGEAVDAANDSEAVGPAGSEAVNPANDSEAVGPAGSEAVDAAGSSEAVNPANGSIADNGEGESERSITSSGGFHSSGSTASGWAEMQTSGEESHELPYFCRMSPEEGGILMTWSDNSFSFVAEEDGIYRWWCDGTFPEPVEAEYYDYSPFPIENVCVFDGERLTLAAYESWYRLNVMVTVYGEMGPTYAGRYLHSLDGDRDMGSGSYYDPYNSIMPQGYRSHSMYWSYGRSGYGGRRERTEPLTMIRE